MEDALTGLLVTAIIIAIILGIVYVIVQFIASKLPQFGNIIMMIFWGLCAIIVLLKIVVPLLGMI